MFARLLAALALSGVAGATATSMMAGAAVTALGGGSFAAAPADLLRRAHPKTPRNASASLRALSCSSGWSCGSGSCSGCCPSSTTCCTCNECLSGSRCASSDTTSSGSTAATAGGVVGAIALSCFLVCLRRGLRNGCAAAAVTLQQQHADQAAAAQANAARAAASLTLRFDASHFGEWRDHVLLQRVTPARAGALSTVAATITEAGAVGISFSGRQIVAVTPGGRADAAGVRVGDVLTHIGGAPTEADAKSAQVVVALTSAARPLTLTLVREEHGAPLARAAITLHCSGAFGSAEGPTCVHDNALIKISHWSCCGSTRADGPCAPEPFHPSHAGEWRGIFMRRRAGAPGWGTVKVCSDGSDGIACAHGPRALPANPYTNNEQHWSCCGVSLRSAPCAATSDPKGVTAVFDGSSATAVADGDDPTSATVAAASAGAPAAAPAAAPVAAPTAAGRGACRRTPPRMLRMPPPTPPAPPPAPATAPVFFPFAAVNVPSPAVNGPSPAVNGPSPHPSRSRLSSAVLSIARACNATPES